MATRTLSSGWTFFLKFIVPAVWFAGVGYVLLLVLLNPVARGSAGGHGASHSHVVWIMLLAMLIPTVIVVRSSFPLKCVRLDGNGELLISNFRQECRIPSSLVVSVEQNLWLRTRLVTLTLRADPGCGTRVLFAPPSRFRSSLAFWQQDPVVAELRELAGARALG